MARRNKVPLFEVMQKTRLEQQQRAAQADLQAQRERLREQRRVEQEAKEAADLAENGPPPPSRMASLLSSFGLAPKSASEDERVSEPDRADPTAGRNASSLYRRVRDSRPSAKPASPPEPDPAPAQPKLTPVAKAPPVEPTRDIEPIEPKPSPFAGLAATSAGWFKAAKSHFAGFSGKVSQAIQEQRDGNGFKLSPVPIALATVGLLLIVAVTYFAVSGDDEFVAVEDANTLPLDPSVVDIGDGEPTPPTELQANRAVENAPPIIVEPEPSVDRERGRYYVAVMSYAGKSDADGAAADLRRAGINVTVEYDLPAYPDRYTVVGTEAFSQPGTGDWEPYVNNIKDVSENRRRTGRFDAFDTQPLFWGN